MNAERNERPHVGFGFQRVLPKKKWRRAAIAAAVILLLRLAFAQPTIRPRREITLTAQSVPLDANDPKRDRVGGLRYLGGRWLQSDDPGFGGLSGLSVEEKQGEVRILAITDQGDKLTGRLKASGDQLQGVDEVIIEPLVNLRGAPIAGKSWGDAESVSRLADGRVLVGFEQRHRVWAYGPGLTGPANVFETPRTLREAPSNGGLESIANWPDGRVLAITEQAKTASGNIAAFLLQEGRWSSVEWTPSASGFEPSDATVLPEGDLLVLERFWSALAPLDLRSRITRVKGNSVAAGAILRGEVVAELRAPLVTENFEGIAAWSAADGSPRLLLVSDNNFNQVQRTLLLEFALEGTKATLKSMERSGPR